MKTNPYLIKIGSVTRHRVPFLLLMIRPDVFAQSVRISGVVATSGSNVAKASVTFIEVHNPVHPYSTITEESGNYQNDNATTTELEKMSPLGVYFYQNYHPSPSRMAWFPA
jgi:hypothetical protein